MTAHSDHRPATAARVLAFVIGASLAAACTAELKPAPLPDPFLVPQSEARAKLAKIAMFPLVVPNGVSDREWVRKRLESLMVEQLRAGGIEVIDSQATDAVVREIEGRVGNVYDPVTGKRDETKYRALNAQVLRELAARHGATAVLRSGIGKIYLDFNNATAVSWMGTSETVGIVEGWWGSEEGSGTIAASTLHVVVRDVAGKKLYEQESGVELLAKIIHGHLQERLALFDSEERNRHAVALALGPLAGAEIPQAAEARR